jgi:hypothetical protein
MESNIIIIKGKLFKEEFHWLGGNTVTMAAVNLPEPI